MSSSAIYTATSVFAFTSVNWPVSTICPLFFKSSTLLNYLVLGHPMGVLPLKFNSNVLLSTLVLFFLHGLWFSPNSKQILDSIFSKNHFYLYPFLFPINFFSETSYSLLQCNFIILSSNVIFSLRHAL